MIDNYAHEYGELLRARDAHKIEMEKLQNENQRLVAQVYVFEYLALSPPTAHTD